MEVHLTNLVVLQDRNATVAQVGVSYFKTEEILTATGSSKREPGEVYDEEVGRDLAVARALKNLGREIERSAMKRYAALNPEPVPAVGEGLIISMGTVTGVEGNTITVQPLGIDNTLQGATVGPIAKSFMPPKKAARPRRLGRKKNK